MVLTGRLRIRVPLLFSDILRCYTDSRGGHTSYYLGTVGDPRRSFIRCSIRGLPAELDVTIDPDKEEQEQGLIQLVSDRPQDGKATNSSEKAPNSKEKALK